MNSFPTQFSDMYHVQSFSFFGIALSFVFGVIGVYFLKAAKQGEGISKAICGITLCVFPFFVSSNWALLTIGVFLVFLPRIIARL